MSRRQTFNFNKITAEWLQNSALQQLLQVLPEVFCVGGCVRNTLLQQPVLDVDLATPLLPEEVTIILQKAAWKVIPTGLAHGTVTAVAPSGEKYQITTFRRDVITYGRKAHVNFQASIAEDAQRRDFTINALYCDATGQIFDPLGGMADINPPFIRFIGNAEERIAEDALRILRYFRFWLYYQAKEIPPCAAALKACAVNAARIGILSKERVRQELFLILQHPERFAALQLMQQAGVLAESGLSQVPLWVDDIKVMENTLSLPPETAPLRLLSCCSQQIEHFSLSRHEKRHIQLLQKAFLENPPIEEKALWVFLDALPWEVFVDFVVILWARSPEDFRPSSEKIRALVEKVKNFKKIIFPITGDFLQEKGIKKGQEIGSILREMRIYWAENGFRLTANELLERFNIR